eukprot:Protomagalhaensia_wolfi_Nauph_80__489@NODE_1276_length_1615_cov_625_889594_g822_i1_p4_GENE_NODE_1276_length_1615_cov_625_889594_g822_i1NODE_1276_length_1615_cov_625_889594_g822_i1_p4_ORF_typecomplete_len105_score5_57Sec15/PF04091_12/0_0069_NODE_1276_length_1615_cov_625_889594_g822_i1464778
MVSNVEEFGRNKFNILRLRSNIELSFHELASTSNLDHCDSVSEFALSPSEPETQYSAVHYREFIGFSFWLRIFLLGSYYGGRKSGCFELWQRIGTQLIPCTATR